MRQGVSVVLLALSACLALAGSPAAAVAAALADAQKLPAEIRERSVYLSLYNIIPQERADFLKALAFHCNTLSREADLVTLDGMVRVTPDLIRGNLDDYLWDKKVWEKLAPLEPYFHLLDPRVTRKIDLAKEVPVAPVPVIPSSPPASVISAPFVLVERDGVLKEIPWRDAKPGEDVYTRGMGRSLVRHKMPEAFCHFRCHSFGRAGSVADGATIPSSGTRPLARDKGDHGVS